MSTGGKKRGEQSLPAIGAGHERIEFNRAYTTGGEFAYMQEAIRNAHLASSGPFSKLCNAWLRKHTGAVETFLTHSCTAALEMAFTLAEIGDGDEVVLPSFTFVTTANAVVARGGRPVFVDVRPDTLCLDESLIESAITARTKAIVPVHYAGVGCEMDPIMSVAARHGLVVVEDAAQAVGATYRGRQLGSFGQLAALSFHETKNVSCGEGGALLVNDESLVSRAEIVHEKGTDRGRFFRGQVDKYSWVDVGSSYALSDLVAAYLWAQLEHESEITAARLQIWHAYHSAFADLEAAGTLRRPVVPEHSEHNAHMYYLLLPDLETRTGFIDYLSAHGVNAVFHYVPLHSSVAGRRYGRSSGSLDVTDDVGDRLVRLPLWAGMTDAHVNRVIETVSAFASTHGVPPRRPPRLRRVS